MMSVSLCGIRFCLGSLIVAASAVVAAQAAASEPKAPSDDPRAIRLFNCDFNWARWPSNETLPHGNVRPSQAEDWAEVDAQQYFDWHREFGNNVLYCQAYCSSGFALYPSKLGPVGKGKAARLFPELYALAREARMPVWSYFCVSADVFQSREHPEWLVPGSVPGSYGHGGFFGPETPHTELVCSRLREFLKDYPVDWLLLDWFVYGSLKPDDERAVVFLRPRAVSLSLSFINLTWNTPSRLPFPGVHRRWPTRERVEQPCSVHVNCSC